MRELKDPGLRVSIHSAENVWTRADHITLSKRLLAKAVSPEIQWWLESYGHVNGPGGEGSCGFEI